MPWRLLQSLNSIGKLEDVRKEDCDKLREHLTLRQYNVDAPAGSSIYCYYKFTCKNRWIQIGCVACWRYEDMYLAENQNKDIVSRLNQFFDQLPVS